MNASIESQVTQHLEWDHEWSLPVLLIGCALIGLWSFWQIFREARIAESRWAFLFIPLRLVVGGVLLWMILGPTTVVVTTETHPRTLGIFIDTSSSMEVEDQSDAATELLWNPATAHSSSSSGAGDSTIPVAAASRASLFADSLYRESKILAQLLQQQASRDLIQKSSARWNELAEKCETWLQSVASFGDGRSGEQSAAARELIRELDITGLQAVLSEELQKPMQQTDWAVSGGSTTDYDQLLRLQETASLFAMRCQVLTEQLLQFAETDSWPKNEPTPTAVTLRAGVARDERINAVLKETLQQWKREGDGQFRIRLSQFSEKVTYVSEEQWPSVLSNSADNTSDNSAAVRKTDLSELLRQIRDETAQEELAAAVLLTDGRQTVEATEDPRALAAQMRIPLYIVPVGRSEMARDLVLHHLQAPSAVVEKDKILIEGLITGYLCSGEECEVQLLEGESLVESKTVTFGGDREDQRFQFSLSTDKPGRREFRVQIPEIRDEHSATNNVTDVAVNVTDAALRILICDSRARWEYQYLVNLFRRQKQIEFDQLQFFPDPTGTGRREATAELPRTADEWAEYRVVILGDIGPEQLNVEGQAALREYIVDRGGSLIAISGQDAMPQSFTPGPLLDLLPVEQNSGFREDKAGYRVEMTAEARTMDAMRLTDDVVSTETVWREMSDVLPVYWLSEYNRPKPASEILLSAISNRGGAVATPMAYLCWHRTGAGRVAFLSSPSTYQLRMRNGDKYHHRFWGQLLRWIVSHSTVSGSKSVRLAADKSRCELGDAIRLMVDLADQQGRPVSGSSPELEILQGDKPRASLQLSADPVVPGRYIGRFAATETGRYDARVTGRTVEQLLAAENFHGKVSVDLQFDPPLDQELQDPRADRPLLEHLADQSGGMVVNPAALGELTQAISLEPRIHQTSQRTPMWDRWWCLWVILGCLTTEWVIRKKTGLA